MGIHQEGRKFLLSTLLVFGILAILLFQFIPTFAPYLTGGLAILYLLFLQFFRNPVRNIPVASHDLIYAPADGKIVVIEETEENEYFKDKRIQISIFMSPLNVHVNRYPIDGTIEYYQYHEGLYLVAMSPKSSLENERTSTVIKGNRVTLLVRQIAGAVARRIINYAQVGHTVVQGTDMGFIKFGSRVDIFLPTDAQIAVEIDQVVKGNQTVIARMV
jgi:phosphatidylserine decarboxylase